MNMLLDIKSQWDWCSVVIFTTLSRPRAGFTNERSANKEGGAGRGGGGAEQGSSI